MEIILIKLHNLIKTDTDMKMPQKTALFYCNSVFKGPSGTPGISVKLTVWVSWLEIWNAAFSLVRGSF